jgi:hypothetical protein
MKLISRINNKETPFLKYNSTQNDGNKEKTEETELSK